MLVKLAKEYFFLFKLETYKKFRFTFLINWWESRYYFQQHLPKQKNNNQYNEVHGIYCQPSEHKVCGDS